ncbi:short-chain dehydrogenase [Chitinophagaceae bacterium IBVUCB1]|nr:short-chain dehydrogenase [Chitinophagaceae bacterium IBVUCB1]
MPNAVITGATQGIGRAIAGKFLSQGFDIAICARNGEDLTALKNEWAAQYPNRSVLAIVADVATKQGAIAFADEVLQHFASIDVLVNNAGTYYPGSLATEPEGQLEQLMNLNLYSAYHITRKLLPVMKQQQQGHIFNICSVASHKAYPGGGAYSITKYALLGFSENLREELKQDMIKVTTVSPGAVYSRSWDGSGVPQERIMQAADIADMVWAAANLSPQACVETILIRPQLGDL